MQSQLQQHLTRDFMGAGLLRIGATYLGELEWKQLFAEVTELDIVVFYDCLTLRWWARPR